jgi:hypothetical protein
MIATPVRAPIRLFPADPMVHLFVHRNRFCASFTDLLGKKGTGAILTFHSTGFFKQSFDRVLTNPASILYTPTNSPRYTISYFLQILIIDIVDFLCNI